MTLVAPQKKPSHHKKTVGKHHRHSKTYHKPYWPYLPMIAVVIAGVIASNASWVTGRSMGSVLSYATEMSNQSLLDGTNTQRLNNGLSALASNGLLNNAAQTKANDMAARDYWSHNTPDNVPPWQFMSNAGYSYQLAGENLAYGFASSSDTITGWMNSPGHRANILNGGYTEVGFGYINIADYQHTGPETLVVAMYGTPANAPAPAPAPVAKQSAPQSPAASVASAAEAADTPAPAQESTPENSDTVTPKDTSPVIAVTSNTELKNVQEPEQQHISRSQVLTAGKATWSGLAVAIIGSGAIVLFLSRHAFAWHKVITRGEQLIIRHPFVDTLFVAAAVAAILLSHSAGVIR